MGIRYVFIMTIIYIRMKAMHECLTVVIHIVEAIEGLLDRTITLVFTQPLYFIEKPKKRIGIKIDSFLRCHS